MNRSFIPGQRGVPELLGFNFSSDSGEGTSLLPRDLIAKELSVNSAHIWGFQDTLMEFELKLLSRSVKEGFKVKNKDS